MKNWSLEDVRLEEPRSRVEENIRSTEEKGRAVRARTNEYKSENHSPGTL